METHTQTNEFIDIFMLNNGKYFPSSQHHEIVQRLRLMPEDRMRYVSTLDFKDPTVSLIISAVGGTLGIDRFFIGDIGMGLLKLFTAGGCGVLWLIDLFLIQERTREINYQKMNEFLRY